VLRRERIQRYHGWTDEQVDIFVTVLYTQSIVTEGKLTVNVVTQDPDDDKFLVCAREGEADYLVSGDDHLLEFRAYEGTQIITPAAFLAVLQPA
jgi:hypothetical protein